MNIALVDDDPVYLSLLNEILSLYGHSVYQATDGQEALTHLRLETPDLIIADVSMPCMNGVALHDTIREDRRLQHVPFVWNSAYAELQELIDISDPSIDFKVDKAGGLPILLHLVARAETSQRFAAARLMANA